MVLHSNDKVILEPLTENDAEIFYLLYADPLLKVNFDKEPFLPGESPLAFTKRIISLCDFIFTIRPTYDPALIIGDCALHHWDKEQEQIFIGGSLVPAFWGKGYMSSAFQILAGVAKQVMGVKYLLGQTSAHNLNAIRMAEKMGFAIQEVNINEVIIKKSI